MTVKMKMQNKKCGKMKLEIEEEQHNMYDKKIREAIGKCSSYKLLNIQLYRATLMNCRSDKTDISNKV